MSLRIITASTSATASSNCCSSVYFSSLLRVSCRLANVGDVGHSLGSEGLLSGKEHRSWFASFCYIACSRFVFTKLRLTVGLGTPQQHFLSSILVLRLASPCLQAGGLESPAIGKCEGPRFSCV